MMKKITLQESRAPYTLAIEAETLSQEAIILERGGQAVAALVPIAEYEAFRAWQQAEAHRQRRQAQKEAFERERATFEQLLPELLQTQPGKVVAIYQGKVVEVGIDIGETLGKVYDRFGYVPCYAQRVEETPHIYKFPHRKIVR